MSKQDIKGTALSGWNSEDYNDFSGNNTNRAGGTPTGAHSITTAPGLKYILSSSGASSGILAKASERATVRGWKASPNAWRARAGATSKFW